MDSNGDGVPEIYTSIEACEIQSEPFWFKRKIGKISFQLFMAFNPENCVASKFYVHISLPDIFNFYKTRNIPTFSAEVWEMD